jgi:L-malate glycosyltransferase
VRILILIPRQPRETGNHVTADRYRIGLQKLGLDVQLAEVAANEPFSLGARRPDIVHLLHAYRTGGPFLAGAPRLPLPFVVTLTGTDVSQGLESPVEGPMVRQVLQHASSVITQNSFTFDDLATSQTWLRQKLHYLPPGVTTGQTPYALRRNHDLPKDIPLFLHPAGIRPVKGNLELLQLFDRLSGDVGFHVAFCGPPLDEDYSRHFFQALRQRPWATYLGVIPPSAMAAALRQTDIVLNNSRSEGLPNSLAEAAVLGRPILAHDIPGNAAVVDEGRNGLLFRNEEEFVRHASSLAADSLLRQRLSRPQPERFDADLEARMLEKIYRGIMEGQRTKDKG